MKKPERNWIDLLGDCDEAIAECEMKMRECPKCGKPMKVWYLLGGKSVWECSCGYVEKIE